LRDAATDAHQIVGRGFDSSSAGFLEARKKLSRRAWSLTQFPKGEKIKSVTLVREDGKVWHKPEPVVSEGTLAQLRGRK
jgi:hypothetical protein